MGTCRMFWRRDKVAACEAVERVASKVPGVMEHGDIALRSLPEGAVSLQRLSSSFVDRIRKLSTKL